MPPVTKTPRAATRPAKEIVLASAVDLARQAAEEVALPGQVGEHTGVVVEGERLLTHTFESLVPGYRGWHWAVTVARPPRGRAATVCEVELLPGDGALLAPAWVPWSERLEPGDVGPTDVLPYMADDERLEQGYEATGEDADELAIYELGLGRHRVLSPEGRAQATTRWYEGDHGPGAPSAKAAAAPCSTCGFLMKLAGSPRTVFGVCANEWSPDDGRVVSMDHGCGAHSETHAPEPAPLWHPSEMVIDERNLEVLTIHPLRPEVVESAEAVEPSEVVEPAEFPDAGAQESTAVEVPAESSGSPAVEAEPAVEAPAAEVPAESSESNVPTETPATEAPAETPATEAPAETPAAEAPAETPAADAPAETPAAEAPAETPVTQRDIPTEIAVEEAAETAADAVPDFDGGTDDAAETEATPETDASASDAPEPDAAPAAEAPEPDAAPEPEAADLQAPHGETGAPDQA
ncbi:DUF3027 domain-containing protein [Georgenia sp. SYP-B2076]|uniref:DUF3027 domain-containing protein n=1 Tax=Georgenia sp. SYP-B2076 TaxID=2495881 RepID=UPI00197ADFD7